MSLTAPYYRFTEGFHEMIDGAEQRVAWRRVDDIGHKNGVLFIRNGTMLHAVAGAGDDAQFAAIRQLWLKGRAG